MAERPRAIRSERVLAAGLVACVVLGATGAGAQQAVDYLDGPTSSCLAANDAEEARRNCIGLAATACMDRSSDGYTTVGMVACTSRETDYWDRRLNDSYAELMARARKADEEDAGLGPIPVATSLRDMQRAWIAFRDASCAFEYSLGRGGTIASLYSASCHLQMTAEQALFLEASATSPELPTP